MKHSQKEALFLVDLQNDFCQKNGSLYVPGGEEVIEVVNKLFDDFDNVIATQDVHPENHCSFAKNHGKKEFETIFFNGESQVMWPQHCIQGSWGADFHPDLFTIPVVFIKGFDPMVDSYSGFFDNGRQNKTQLDYYLQQNGINELYICGVALDYCVLHNCLDALSLGYKVKVIKDGCRAVDQTKIEEVYKELESKGAKLI